MTRWLRSAAVIVLCAMAVSLAGCGEEKATPSEDGGAYFTGEVTGVSNSTVLVKVTDSGNSGISKGSEAEVSVSETDGDFPEYEIGDTVRISFDGEVMETYPLRIKSVSEIVVTEE